VKHALHTVVLLAAVAASPVVAQDDAAKPADAATVVFEPTVVDAVNRVILPGYAALTVAASDEARRVNDLCRQADTQRLQAARDGFATLVLAWSGAEMVRFGPVRDDNNYERLFFWPDPRGRGLQQVQALLATQDATAAGVDRLREKSVAVQGLSALEYILFGTGSEALADTNDPARSFRCRYGAAIAGAIATTADAIRDGWTGQNGYAFVMREPGPDNAVYRSAGEAMQDLLKSCREQVQLDQQLKLAFTVGETPAKANPKMAPFWRSNLTIPSIKANLAAVLELCGANGVGAILPADAAGAATALADDLKKADDVLARLEQTGKPWETLATEPASHADLTAALTPLGAAGELLEHEYMDAFGLVIGINSLDGD